MSNLSYVAGSVTILLRGPIVVRQHTSLPRLCAFRILEVCAAPLKTVSFNPLSAEFFFTKNNFLQPIFEQFCKLNLLFYTQTMYITFVALKSVSRTIKKCYKI